MTKVYDDRYSPMNEEQWELVQADAKRRQIDIEKGVDIIIKWINDQPHLPNYTDSRNKIRHYLYKCDFSLEKTKTKMDLYYTIRRALPELFSNWDPLHHKVQTVLDMGYIIVLPKLTPEGYRVIFCAIKEINYERANALDLARALLMMGEVFLSEDFNRGVIVVADNKRFTLRHLMMFDVPLATKAFRMAKKALPCKAVMLYTLNVLPKVEKAARHLVKLFFSDSIYRLVSIHNESEGYKPLLDIAGKENCPYEFGGTFGSLDEMNGICRNVFESYRDWFLNEDNRSTNESLRPSTAFDISDLYGLDGSFRKLEID